MCVLSVTVQDTILNVTDP